MTFLASLLHSLRISRSPYGKKQYGKKQYDRRPAWCGQTSHLLATNTDEQESTAQATAPGWSLGSLQILRECPGPVDYRRLCKSRPHADLRGLDQPPLTTSLGVLCVMPSPAASHSIFQNPPQNASVGVSTELCIRKLAVLACLDHAK